LDKWNHGPEWLTTASHWSAWQRLEVFNIQGAADKLVEVCKDRATPAVKSGINNIIELTKFSTLSKLTAVTAYVRRFIHNCRQPVTSRIIGPLTVPELTQANILWLRQIQSSVFPDEVTNLKSKSNCLPLVRIVP